MKSELYLILDNIRSVHNVGSIFRTADAAGVTKIYCVGITPTPIDRFGRVRKDFIKASLGAETTVPWEAATVALDVIRELKKKEVRIVALEQTETALSYREEQKVSVPTALIVGNEKDGVSAESLVLADAQIMIPMHGTKESLNVSVATGIALFRLLGE